MAPLFTVFLVPLFVALFAVVVLAIGPKADGVARRVVLASAVWLMLDYVAFGVWQFLGDGWLFNVGFYFSSFLVPSLLCLAAATAVLIGGGALSRRSIPVGVVCAVAVLTPVAWIYKFDSGLPITYSGGYADGWYIGTLVAMGAAIVIAVLSRVLRLRALSAAALAAGFFAVASGVASSSGTYVYGASNSRTGGLYDVGQKLIGHLHANGYAKTLPRFWYDSSDTGLRSLQSLYYYSYTYVGIAMPSIDREFHDRMALFRPEQLVLLCAEPDCKGAEAALRRAGYRPRLLSQEVLESHDLMVWVKTYRVAPRPGHAARTSG